VLDRSTSIVATAAKDGPPAAAATAPTSRGEALRRWVAGLPHAFVTRSQQGAAQVVWSAQRTAQFFRDGWYILRTEGLAGLVRRIWQFFVELSFSSLTRRIVFINLLGLFAFVVGVLFLPQFRAGLIDAQVQRLLIQGEIIAGAIAGSATVETDSITIDPDRLMDLRAGESYGPPDDALFGLEFPINPERVAPLLRRLVSPTNTRARIYDRDGVLLLDSRSLYGRGDVLRYDLPAPTAEKRGLLERSYIRIRKWLSRGNLPRYYEIGPANGKNYAEVAQALNGAKGAAVMLDDRGQVIVSVAVPVQRFRTVRGALLLSTQGGDIDQIVEAERLSILKIAMIATGVMVALSMLLAATIGGPVRRLAEAADHVRRRIRSRVEIPDFTRRHDEIGELSGTLRAMTDALYTRIEAIESFAADVAHELKNVAARQNRGEPRAASVGDPARRAPARPADLRHFRRQPARCGIAAPGHVHRRHAPPAEHGR
jgi:two-component system, OmpR family, sensor histidine kinase ChvG